MKINFLLILILALLSFTVVAQGIKKVHVVYMNHLDAGFTELVEGVVNNAFHKWYPTAMRTANIMRQKNERYVYTTHGWLLNLFFNCPANVWKSLKCPTDEQKDELTAAIKRGDITWHAFPFNAELEVFDKSLLNSALESVEYLDNKFNVTRKIVLSQRDVPGTTISALPLLNKKGIRAITIGVNAASSPPETPTIFKWKHVDSGAEVIGMIHPGGYGGIEKSDAVTIDGHDEALLFCFRSDNQGPHQPDEVLDAIKHVREQYPGASVEASTIDNFVNGVLSKPDILNKLKVITSEIGDTWLYGVASDFRKVSDYRVALRARDLCFRAGKCSLSDERVRNFDLLFMKIGEHTWGKDVKTHLHDPENFDNEKFHKKLIEMGDNYKNIIDSWVEQRSFLDMALAQLKDHPLKSTIEYELLNKHTSLFTRGFTKTKETSFELDAWSIGFDPSTGSINKLIRKKSGRVLATKENQIASVSYQTLNSADYDTFLKHYLICLPECEWGYQDFGKPGLEKINATSTTYNTQLESISTKTLDDAVVFLIELSFPSISHANYGAPEKVLVMVTLSKNKDCGMVSIDVEYQNKTPTRIPESLWVSFNPNVPNPNDWFMSKLDTLVSPVDIAGNGSVHLHGVDDSSVIYVSDDYNSIVVRSEDAPLVAFGERVALPTPMNVKPDMKKGFHFNAMNNLWGTNYIMWYPYLEDEDTGKISFTFSDME
ncbi:hypothetical protein AKO1_001653 [Acrasis kona]|uniref:Glycoside hydrolase family 38 N-terminal domain-containing protein n=1 Tax=Acrasis kona TaxID=1008807 RepID=A0AAW2ZBL5_9EUKA